MTSLGDDARETLTIAGLEKAKERALEQHLRLRAPQTWTVLCASVDQYLRTTVDSGSMSRCACCGKAGHEKARCRFRNAMCSNCGKTEHLRAMCRQREKVCWQVKSLEQQWQEFWQRQCEPWKHRQVLLLWTGRSSTT